MGKNFIITGATSFIGSGLLRRLVGEADCIYAVCKPGTKRMDRIPDQGNIRIVECALDCIEQLDSMIDEKCDVFYHLAWEGTAEKNDCYIQNKNVEYTLNAVNVAKRLRCKVFIGAGSQAEYGVPNVKINEKSPVFPITGYGMAKLCAGQMGNLISKENGMKFIWARIFSVYGPYDGPNTLISMMMRCFNTNEIPSLTKGEQIWDYLYIDDCAEALFLLGEKEVKSTVYNIGSGEECKLRDYAIRLKNIVAPEKEICFGLIPYDYEKPMFLSANIKKIFSETGFRPRVSFEEGIAQLHAFNSKQMR